MRQVLLWAALLLGACPRVQKPATPPAPASQAAAPDTPNRFDSLAWPDLTIEDRYTFAERIAPALLAMIEKQKIAFDVVPLATLAEPLDAFLRSGLPPAGTAPEPAAPEGIPGMTLRALWLGPESQAWSALDAALLAQGKKSRRTPVNPPGAIQLEGERITIGYDTGLGLEWFSYLTCKALLRSSGLVRAGLLGGSSQDPYRWTPGEEEFCLWSLLGTREHLRAEASMGRNVNGDPSLTRLDAAARAGHTRGFVLVEFLLPRRGSLAGLPEAELKAAAEYFLAHSLEINSLAVHTGGVR